MLKKTLYLFCLTLCSCSLFGDEEVAAPNETETIYYKIEAIDLYISRASKNRADFEQYKIQDKLLFFECGQLVGGQPDAKSRALKKVSPDEALELKNLANKIVNFKVQKGLELEAPGASTSMFDPGQLILKIKLTNSTQDVSTSLNSIATADQDSENLIKSLAQKIREYALHYSSDASLCGLKRFHDL